MLSQYNTTLVLSNCQIHHNEVKLILSVKVLVFYYNYYDIPMNIPCVFLSNVSTKNFIVVGNHGHLFHFYSTKLAPCANFFIEHIYLHINNYLKNYDVDYEFMHITRSAIVIGQICVFRNKGATVLLAHSSHILINAPLNISGNEVANDLMIFQSCNVLFNAPITISKNSIVSVMQMYSCNASFNGSVRIYDNIEREFTKSLCNYVILFEFCNILFSKTIDIISNQCERIIIIKSDSESAYIKVMEYSYITLAHNINSNPIAIEIYPAYNNPYPFCLFQYVTLQNASIILPSHYTIIIISNYFDIQYDCTLSFHHFTFHCKWIPTAVFYDNRSSAINQHIIQVNQNLWHSTIVHYSNFSITNTLGPVCPGQVLQVELFMPCSDNHSVLYAETHNILLPKSACKVSHQNEIVNFISSNSKIVNYTIVSDVNNSCELFLTVSPFLHYIYEVFDVQLLPCPIGFTLQNGVCNCDPLLPTGIDTCYIDQSAIRRPANTWISYTQSDTSKYLISHCPMDYCLPFSLNVNLLYPDTQCQFNRTGLLCSQCPHPLSMVFGSSRCMKCTNVHILITIIVIVAGIVLVVLLYLLNLTVTKASINGMILYANIISINDSVFLINDNVLNPLRIFISFLNLDLGIESCFYNGMDSYAKIWLQLFFPTYLIIIAVTIIITSRYSSRIFRLTYKRSLPVLATLFLLSYTGVLRTVSAVLFSYSTIIHAPSGHQELVWTVDPSVPLFGLKFTILFITCLILFLLLLIFNITLLFKRYLTRFKLINYFKPILDAFQGSYKDRYYYWVAVHIILRGSFFTLYAFHIKVRLLLTTIILVPFTGIFGYVRPNKNEVINFQELLLLINLTIMYEVSYYGSDSAFSIIINLMISVAFIQLCIIVTYHFFTYTCHCDIKNTLCTVKEKLAKQFRKDHQTIESDVSLLDIPERTYNYSEYQDGLHSDDFLSTNNK